ncbi:hypothetical protein DFH07DRAFT_936175 [Mycena maculata]|uniref:F-box domain-containing protein n=1 Tax=Mycena maculata TaxID=230809 RepID=A0AAD7KAD3_9AGAR|nr:hypothetical protein DFH07DRAFT_936175 [Mycena maculata]
MSESNMSEANDNETASLASMLSALSIESATVQCQGLLNDFPLKIISRILLCLLYPDLIRVPRISKQWKALVESDSALAVRTFRKASAVYVETATDGTQGEEEEKGEVAERSERRTERTWMHPVLKEVSFTLTDEVAGVENFKSDMTIPLTATSVANDLATIPAVRTLKIIIEEGWPWDEVFTFEIDVKTARAPLTWIYSPKWQKRKRTVETQEGPMSMAEALGDHVCDVYLDIARVLRLTDVFYEGLAGLKREGTALTAHLCLPVGS